MYKLFLVSLLVLLPNLSSAYGIHLPNSSTTFVWQSASCYLDVTSGFVFTTLVATQTGYIDYVDIDYSIDSDLDGSFFTNPWYMASSTGQITSFTNCPTGNDVYITPVSYATTEFTGFNGTSDNIKLYSAQTATSTRVDTLDSSSDRTYTISGETYYIYVGHSNGNYLKSLNLVFSGDSNNYVFNTSTSTLNAYNWLYGLQNTGGLNIINGQTEGFTFGSGGNYNALQIADIQSIFDPVNGYFISNATSGQVASIISNATTSGVGVTIGYTASGTISTVNGSPVQVGCNNELANDNSTSTLFCVINSMFSTTSTSSLQYLFQNAFPFNYFIVTFDAIRLLSSGTIYTIAANEASTIRIPMGAMGTQTININGIVTSTPVLVSFRQQMGNLVYVMFILTSSIALLALLR